MYHVNFTETFQKQYLKTYKNLHIWKYLTRTHFHIPCGHRTPRQHRIWLTGDVVECRHIPQLWIAAENHHFYGTSTEFQVKLRIFMILIDTCIYNALLYSVYRNKSPTLKTDFSIVIFFQDFALKTAFLHQKVLLNLMLLSN